MEKALRKIAAPLVFSCLALSTYACSSSDEDPVEETGDGGAGGEAGDGDGGAGGASD